jgi:hypothetical protein
MKSTEQLSFSPDLSRLFAAAVVSPDFCQMLLQDTATALASGYHGESFTLPPAEETLLLSIEAHTLADFASQVVSGKSVQTEVINESRPMVPASGRSHENGASFAAYPGF